MENVGAKAQTRFETVFLSDTFEHAEGLPELIFWCNKFNELDLCPSYGQGSFGNLSCRLSPGSNRFIITASALELKEKLSSEDFVLVESVDMKDSKVFCRGSKVPSSESILHYAIYKERKDINAIFHGHCKEILDNSSKFVCTKEESPYGSLELVNGVIDILSDNFFIIMKKHGFISIGTNMEQAGNAAVKARSGFNEP